MFYKVSRLSVFHNILRRIANSILFVLPVSLKYGVGEMFRSTRLPYKMIEKGWTVVQIGAPWDLLKAGRSRSIYFSKRVGDDGRVVVIEADEANVKALNVFIENHGINNITVVQNAAWSKATQLRFLIDDKHPASNLVEEVYDSGRVDRSKYREVLVDANSVDNILDSLQIDSVDFLSVTSNGSEDEILKGIERRATKVRYISIIGEPEKFKTICDYGFVQFAEDDRGALYRLVEK
ncbi:methyltransferase, FkbM family [Mariprofundus ferrinatatus]|uniref:Methyltransferase, FkbM family n=1 Tax=Mariprofundus ferrinatatus TaxID=1921087 RepID=A0A2K8L3V3_9PROT|nr:FkbM family methyltransferase [Mariprofundus ferrinatatus]ATX82008.1 methyltransferase, FkbM family [Mariprofundus ferrinatatus]